MNVSSQSLEVNDPPTHGGSATVMDGIDESRLCLHNHYHHPQCTTSGSCNCSSSGSDCYPLLINSNTDSETCCSTSHLSSGIGKREIITNLKTVVTMEHNMTSNFQSSTCTEDEIRKEDVENTNIIFSKAKDTSETPTATETNDDDDIPILQETPATANETKDGITNVLSTAKKQIRRVRFMDPMVASVVCYLPTRTELSLSEQRACWWRPDDFYLFKKAAVRLSRDVRSQNNSVLQNLERSGYSNAKYLAITMEEYQMDQYLQDAHNPAITEWATSSSLYTVRGLEYWASGRHGTDRTEAMRECLQTVLELSRYKEKPEEIAKQSQEYSRASRIMARWWGVGDAVVARQEEQFLQNESLVSASATASTQVNKPTTTTSAHAPTLPATNSNTSNNNNLLIPRTQRRWSTGGASISNRLFLRAKLFR